MTTATQDQTWTRCVYWIGSDAKGHRCADDAITARHCAKHYPIARARAERDMEADRAKRERADAAWIERNRWQFPTWRTHLERAEAEYARRTASPTQDRAAVGGNIGASIVRMQARHLSDTNVDRILELDRIIRTLKSNLERMDRLTPCDMA